MKNEKIFNLIKEKLTKKSDILFIRIGNNSEGKKLLEKLDDDKEIRKNVYYKNDKLLYLMKSEPFLLNAIYEELDHTKKYK